MKTEKKHKAVLSGDIGTKRTNARTILLLILLVFLSPLIIGGAGGILGVLAAVLLAPFLAVFIAGACMRDLWWLALPAWQQESAFASPIRQQDFSL